MAPAVRVAWAEEFGLSSRQGTTGRMVAALKRLGFDYVFDTNFSADLTIMEEGSEFWNDSRIAENTAGRCSHPAARVGYAFLKSQYPDYVENLSTAKSPQQMFGAVAKSYFAEKMGIDPHKLCVVSIMPCSAKKAERELPHMDSACGDPDVDVVLTTREMCRLLRSDCLVPGELEEEPFDSPAGHRNRRSSDFRSHRRRHGCRPAKRLLR